MLNEWFSLVSINVHDLLLNLVVCSVNLEHSIGPHNFISNSQDQFWTAWPTGIAGERQEGQRWKWRWERRQRKGKGEREEEGKGEVKEGERKEGERKVQEGQKREGERQRERQRSWQGKEPQKSALIFVVSSKREESEKMRDYVWLCIYPVPSSKPMAILLLGLHVVQVCNLCVKVHFMTIGMPAPLRLCVVALIMRLCPQHEKTLKMAKVFDFLDELSNPYDFEILEQVHWL